MKPSFALLSVSLLVSLGSLHAQTVLIDWDHEWNYLHPNRGALPANSGTTTPHPDGGTPWFATQADFDAGYAGPSFTTSGPGFVSGRGPGPFGYGAMDYLTTPLPAPGEFVALGTTLPTPIDGQRNTVYFRTTFTVPDDGVTYDSPVLRYLLDDGGFVYLDGELILEANIPAGTSDDFMATAANATNTESHIRTAELDLAPGATTGGNEDVAPAIAGNAAIVKQIESLAPGEHTLAVALHNAGTGSSDQFLAVQLLAGTPACVLDATVKKVDINPNNTVNITLNVEPTGTFGAGWQVTEPAGSQAAGKGGAYNSDVVITGIPDTEFAGGNLLLTIADNDDPACIDRVPISLPVIIALDARSAPGEGVPTTGNVPAGWVVDSAARTVTMNNGGTRQVVQSVVLDLSSSRAVQFNGILEINDTSSGNEPADVFVASLIIDGDTANPINLITPYDTIVPDGVLTDNELAPAPGNYIYPLEYLIPATASSVQIVIDGINNSGSETFIVRDLVFTGPPPGSLPPFLDIENGTGDTLVLTWESQGGFLYNIRSETDPSNGDPIDWPIFSPHMDIAATPPFNTLTIPLPPEPSRFFVVESFPAPPSAVFSDDFETGAPGWTVGSDRAAGTAWELGTPTLGAPGANSGANCYGTNLAGEYAIDANVWLRSPPVDLTTAGSATLKYFQVFDIELQFDSATVSILDAADNSVLSVVQGPFDGFSADWEEVTVAIPATALGKTVIFEWRLQSDDIGNFAGLFVDDVLVTIP